MNINKLPAQVAIAILGLLMKILISLLVAIIVAFILTALTEEWPLLFLGAMIMQLVIRVFEKDVRRDIKNIWIYFKAENPNLSHWQYSSKKEKVDMEFYNFINHRTVEINTPATKEESSLDN